MDNKEFNRELLIVMTGRLLKVEQDIQEAKALLNQAERFVKEVRNVIDPEDHVKTALDKMKKEENK